MKSYMRVYVTHNVLPYVLLQMPDTPPPISPHHRELYNMSIIHPITLSNSICTYFTSR